MAEGRVVIRRLREAELGPMIDLWKMSGLSHKPRGRDRISALKAQRKGSPDLFLGAFDGNRLVVLEVGKETERAGVERSYT